MGAEVSGWVSKASKPIGLHLAGPSLPVARSTGEANPPTAKLSATRSARYTVCRQRQLRLSIRESCWNYTSSGKCLPGDWEEVAMISYSGLKENGAARRLALKLPQQLLHTDSP